MAKQHFFLKDRWIGARDIPTWESTGDRPHITGSKVLFCPHCAEIWGKIMHDTPGAYCQVITSSCPEHATFASDGTFSSNEPFEGDPRGDFNSLPPAVKRHDVWSLSGFYLNHPDKFYYDIP